MFPLKPSTPLQHTIVPQDGGQGTDNALTLAAAQEGADLWTNELFSPCFVPSRHTVWVAEEIIRKIEEKHPLGYVSLHIRRGDKLKTGNFLVGVCASGV